MKAATPCKYDSNVVIGISIHAAREGGDHVYKFPFFDAVISIHAAREGGDGKEHEKYQRNRNFNPRRP